MNINYLIASLFVLLTAVNHVFCQKTGKENHSSPDGKLFIIGGGAKTETLMLELLRVSGVNASDYVIILPMSSEEPDSSVYYIKKDFAAVGINQVVGFNFTENGPVSKSQMDSIRNAKMIFITGGNQNKFMQIVGKGPVYTTIHSAYNNGATIAGTSAGAAVMSKKMITGNSLKSTEYTGRYPTIEPDNIEIKEGLGLVDQLIVDQHFIKRQRMNRLVSVVLENPDEVCVGIDESTAIIVSGNSFSVAGENQVIVLRNPKKSKIIRQNLLGGKGLKMDVLLPGESYKMK